jgi:hypothetical protein
MDYDLKKRMFELPQSSMVTCWAACAAMLKSYERQTYVLETSILTGSYLNLFNNNSILPFSSVVNFFETTMSFKTETWDANAPFTVDAWKNLMDKYGPLIVPAPVLGTGSAHIRVMHGIWGSGSPDTNTQFKIFDPFQSTSLKTSLRILFPHIVYQISASIPVIGRPNIIWHLP